MTCKQCDIRQDEGFITYYRWKESNVGMSGCNKHLREIFDALNNSTTTKQAVEENDKKWEHHIKTRIGQTKAWLRKEDDNTAILYYKHRIETLSDLLEEEGE